MIITKLSCPLTGACHPIKGYQHQTLSFFLTCHWRRLNDEEGTKEDKNALARCFGVICTGTAHKHWHLTLRFIGRYGAERYETRDLQQRVRQRFADLQTQDEEHIAWHVVNAAQTVEFVEAEIWTIVEQTLKGIGEKPLQKLWGEGKDDEGKGKGN